MSEFLHNRADFAGLLLIVAEREGARHPVLQPGIHLCRKVANDLHEVSSVARNGQNAAEFPPSLLRCLLLA